MSARPLVLFLVLACGAPPPPPREPEPAAPVATPSDPTSDCNAVAEILSTFQYPKSDTPSEADLVRYYGNVAKAFREARLETPEVKAVAKDVAELFTTLGGRAEAIAKAHVAYEGAVHAKNMRLHELYEAMRLVWKLRDSCESEDCKKLFDVEKAHHAVVRMPLDDTEAFRGAVRAFRDELAALTPASKPVGYARKHLDATLAAFEDASIELASAQTSLDETVRAKESKHLRGRLLAMCPDLDPDD